MIPVYLDVVPLPGCGPSDRCRRAGRCHRGDPVPYPWARHTAREATIPMPTTLPDMAARATAPPASARLSHVRTTRTPRRSTRLGLLSTRLGCLSAPVALAVLGTAVAGCTSTAARPVASSTTAAGASPYGQAATGTLPPGSSTAADGASRATTRAFTVQIESATSAFVTAVGRLGTDVTTGDTAAARTDELAAQAAFDGFRVLESGNAVNGSSLDEVPTDVAALESFGGLHAVERDLWMSGPLVTDVSALAGQAPVAQFLLGREHLGPEAVGLVAVDQLTWVVDTALAASQEQYSHRGLVDVAATELAAHHSFTDIEPLARLVDPTRTETVAGQFAVLDAEVAALGDPATTPDSSVAPTAGLALSRQLDATASGLAGLVARLAPFGTRGAPS